MRENRISKNKFAILGVSLLAISLIAGLSLNPAFAEPKGKIIICHEGDEGPETISVNENAKDAHLAHGDTLGACGDVTPPAAPTLLGPADGSVFDLSEDTSILFSWSEVSDPSGVSYTLRILDGEGQTVFSKDINKDTNTNSPGFQYSEDIDSDTDSPGVYLWNVFATDGAGNEGPFATTSFSFTLVP